MGDSSFILPVKYSWTMKEKLWPSIARMNHVKKSSTHKLIEDTLEKIDDHYITQVIIQNTNEISMHAAAALWRSIEPSQLETRETQNQADIQSYNNLLETLNSLLNDNTSQVLFPYI
jgi:hypothetical protein